jgi:hypothetical protein
MREVITHGGTARLWKVCRCHWCGIEAHCTPNFDFYTHTPTDPLRTGPLYCASCIAGIEGIPLISSEVDDASIKMERKYDHLDGDN